MNDDIVVRLRNAPWTTADDCNAAADEIERLREELTASHESHGNEVGALTERLALAIHERDEARRRTNSILTEIDCRIEHGAESNGHLEAICSLFKENTDE